MNKNSKYQSPLRKHRAKNSKNYQDTKRKRKPKKNKRPKNRKHHQKTEKTKKKKLANIMISQINTITSVKMLIFLLSGTIHFFGLYLLSRVKPNQSFNSIQRFYLINLSICELFISVENSIVEFALRATSDQGITPACLNRFVFRSIFKIYYSYFNHNYGSVMTLVVKIANHC